MVMRFPRTVSGPQLEKMLDFPWHLPFLGISRVVIEVSIWGHDGTGGALPYGSLHPGEGGCLVVGTALAPAPGRGGF
jgi:hypothetical protein